MPDPTKPEGATPDSQGAAPAAGAPPAAAPPAAPAAPVAAAPAAAPPAKPPKGKKAPENASRPQNRQQRLDHKAWLEHQVEARVARQLGMSLEEAKAAIARGAAPAAPAAAAPAAQPQRSGPDPKVQQKLQELTGRVESQSQRIKKLKQRHADELVNLAMRSDALAVGIHEDHVDFALNLYAGAVRAAKDAPPEPRAFFAGLREKRAYLFREGAPVVDLRPTTAAPESTAPGGETPRQNPPATPTKQPNAMDMNEDEWRAHKRRMGIPGLG